MKRLYLAGICLFGMWLCLTSAGPVFAETNVKDCIENDDCAETDSAETEKGTAANTSDTQTLINLVKMVLALLLVLALIYALLKLLSKRNKRHQPVKELENMGGVSVGPNKSVQLVRVGSKLFLVGVGDDVALLDELNDEDMKEQLLHKERTDGQQSSYRLPALFHGKHKPNNMANQTNDFKQRFAAELSKLKQTRQSFQKQREQRDDRDE